jgi:hypothetical protein
MTVSERVTAGSGRTSPRLTPQEVICNLPLGQDQAASPLPRYNGGSLADAFEEVILPALLRSPCVVSFSGGRDSSAVLAVAVEIARRQGLPEPTPVIMRHPNDPNSDETQWQELVLNHLRIKKCEVVTITDELDALGPMATDTLRRHGLHWPANAFAHRPVIDLARGGSLLTGIGGDELFSAYPPLTCRHTLLLAAPFRVREAWLLRTLPFAGFEWLTPTGRRLAQRGYAQDEATEWLGWERTIRRWYRTRYFSAMASGLDLVAAGQDVRVINPCIHERLLVELVHLAGRDGFPSRTDAMRRLFGHLLPDAILARRTKATFGGELWGAATRNFMSSWSGNGTDPRLVDAGRLRREFSGEQPNFRAVLLLHQAWLHDHPPSTSIS